MNSYYTSIIQQIKTTEDAEQLSIQIDKILEDLFSIHHKTLTDLLDENLSSEIGLSIKNTFHDHGMSWEHHEEVKSFFQGLQEEIKKFTVMTLTLAYHPTERQLQKLKNWTVYNLDGNYIFEIQHDPDILGGAIIILNGHYLDLSLKKQLDNYFLNQK